MQSEWLNKKNHSSLILFFSGWGGCTDLFKHLLSDEYDVLHVSDYREYSAIPQLEKYQEIVLIAWSFGVASSNFWQHRFAIDKKIFSKKIAINGTQIPVDKQLGIPPNILDLTINTLSEQSLKKFRQRCAMNICTTHYSLETQGQVSTTNTPNTRSVPTVMQLKQELVAIRDREYADKVSHWDSIILSNNDPIFSFKNCSNAWHDNKENISINTEPHFPFKQWHNWSDIVDN